VRELSRAPGPKIAKIDPPRLSRLSGLPARSLSSPSPSIARLSATSPPRSRTHFLRSAHRMPAHFRCSTTPSVSPGRAWCCPLPPAWSTHRAQSQAPVASRHGRMLSRRRTLSILHPCDCYCQWCRTLLFVSHARRAGSTTSEVRFA
jgi:hypothetical protein